MCHVGATKQANVVPDVIYKDYSLDCSCSGLLSARCSHLYGMPAVDFLLVLCATGCLHAPFLGIFGRVCSKKMY